MDGFIFLDLVALSFLVFAVLFESLNEQIRFADNRLINLSPMPGGYVFKCGNLFE